MTRAEEGLLLLCCPLGDAAARPLTAVQYRVLAARVQASKRCGDPTRELTEDDLRSLGCPPQEAARIAGLLRRETQLARYLAAAERRGISVLTRLSPDYPARLRAALGTSAPAALFYAGDRRIISRAAVALVGSRALRETGRQFAARVGTLAAREGFVLSSGGAAGADTCAQEACLAAGGQVVCFTADALSRRLETPRPDGLMLVGELGWDIPFSTPRALSRNRLIHALSMKAFVAQTDCGTGGTWHGACENLKRQWSPVFVCNDASDGARALCARGASAVSLEQLTSLRACLPNQTSLF